MTERDAIIREIVKEAHKAQIVRNDELAVFQDGVSLGYDAASSAEWVAVSDRLPEMSGIYRVTTAGGSVRRAWFRGDIWLELAPQRRGDVPESLNILAWMPDNEPAPYTPKEQI